MSNGGDSPTDQLPPPAYEVTEQEFDRKTSRAVEESLSTALSNVRVVDDDGWPIYDAASFEAVAASFEREANNASLSSPPPSTPRNSITSSHSAPDVKMPVSLPRVEPLRVKRRSDRPSEHRTRTRSSLEVQVRSTPLTLVNPPSPTPSDIEPPPPFTPVARHPNASPLDDLTRLSYHNADSRPSSCLSSPIEPTPPHQPPGSHPAPASVTPRPRRRARQSHDLLSSFKDGPMARFSRLDFDPRSAYGKDSYEVPDTQASNQVHSASAFYHHAVASQMEPIQTPTRPHVEQTYPSAASQSRSPPPPPPQSSPNPSRQSREIISVVRASPSPSPSPVRPLSQPPPVPVTSPQPPFGSCEQFPNPYSYPRESRTPVVLTHSPSPVRMGGMDTINERAMQYQYALSEAQLIRDLYRARG